MRFLGSTIGLLVITLAFSLVVAHEPESTSPEGPLRNHLETCRNCQSPGPLGFCEEAYRIAAEHGRRTGYPLGPMRKRSVARQ